MTFLYYLFLTIFLIFSIFTCLIILMQEAKSLGLGASFGGDSGDSLFGTSTAEVLKKFTAYLITFFMIGCVILSLWTANIGRKRNPIEPIQSEEVMPDQENLLP